MTNNTNFHNLKELLEVYEPESRGVMTDEEYQLIEEKLEIKSMEVMELRNLRDFVVLYLSRHPNEGNLMNDYLIGKMVDKASAITAVIDKALFDKGVEV